MKVDDDKTLTINNRFVVGVALMPCNQEECIINIQR
jgi:hypothetical protein